MLKKILSICLSLLVLIACLCGCGNEKAEENGKINVVATIFPEYDFARAITGDKANLVMLTKPGASVHSFDPSPADISNIKNADVFIYVGGESSVWVDNILESVDSAKTKIIRLMDFVNVVDEEIKEGMEEESEEAHGDEEGGEEETEKDEHIWTSLKNAVKLIDAINAGICEKDAANSAFYTENADKYKSELVSLDRQINDTVTTAKQKFIIVADKFPFRYFVDDYSLDYAAAFPGCSDQADAGVKTIANLVNQVKSRDIKFVYHVELSNKSTATAIAQQTGCEILLLNSCHNVSRDDFENGVTYLDMMRQNAVNLEKGLNS